MYQSPPGHVLWENQCERGINCCVNVTWGSIMLYAAILGNRLSNSAYWILAAFGNIHVFPCYFFSAPFKAFFQWFPEGVVAWGRFLCRLPAGFIFTISMKPLPLSHLYDIIHHACLGTLPFELLTSYFWFVHAGCLLVRTSTWRSRPWL